MKTTFAFAYVANSESLPDIVNSLNKQSLFPDEDRPITVQFSKGCIMSYMFNYLINRYDSDILIKPTTNIIVHHIPTIATIATIPTIPNI